ncbi:Uncharacterised protein [Bordetella pertussis]|nr:Uncharacterised protein [Bordetella pertussis]
MARGSRAGWRLRCGSNSPSSCSCAFRRRKASYRLPTPARRMPSACNW